MQVPGPDANSEPSAVMAAVIFTISLRLVEHAKARHALQIASPGACCNSPRTMSSACTREA
jgi:hypothetical protein